MVRIFHKMTEWPPVDIKYKNIESFGKVRYVWCMIRILKMKWDKKLRIS